MLTTILLYTAVWLLLGWLTFRVVLVVTKGVKDKGKTEYKDVYNEETGWYESKYVTEADEMFNPRDGLWFMGSGPLALACAVFYGLWLLAEKLGEFFQSQNFNRSTAVNKFFGTTHGG